ncbi:MAG: helix-turn-helix domain-containing protein [Ardenticatenaceae bacterium]
MALPRGSTTPTVRDMGRLALPLGSRLVAGSLGLERPVRWARTSGVLSPLFPVLNKDEVALLDLPLVQTSNPALPVARVVRELGRLGLAALVVKGKVDRVGAREAERSNLPLYLLPEDADVGRAARAIIRLLSDREAQEEAQAAALYRWLSQRVAAGAGLGALVGELHRLVGHAVHITDLDGKMLACAGSAPLNSEELTHSVAVGDTPIARLMLRDTPAALDAFAHIALEQGAAALALELVKIEAVEAAREGVYGDFVTSLLQGEEESVLLNQARAAEYPFDNAQWALVAIADAAQADEKTMRAWISRAATRAESLSWDMRANLSQESVALIGSAAGARAVYWQAVLVLAGGDSVWEPSRDAFLDYLAGAWPDAAPLSLAAGDPAMGVEGLRRAHTEAQDALFLGLRLFGEGNCFLHREMGLYRLLRHLQGTDDLEHFLRDTLDPLIAYDDQHQTELLDTLQTLLEQGGNISATAKALHLHRNSLVYRLERIRAISSLDPTDPDDAFTLKLALLLAPLR